MDKRGIELEGIQCELGEYEASLVRRPSSERGSWVEGVGESLEADPIEEHPRIWRRRELVSILFGFLVFLPLPVAGTEDGAHA
jgi:hypothetical protein